MHANLLDNYHSDLMARVWNLKSTDRTQMVERTYSVGSLSEVTSVNSPSCGDAVRASSFHLTSVSFASSFSSSNSSALFSFSQASNQAKISSFSFLANWSILSASLAHSLHRGACVFSSCSVKRYSYFTIFIGKSSHPQ